MPHSYNARAQDLASKGRYGDSMLVHMNPSEVRGLEQGRGVGLTRNPDTGLPEAFLPAILVPMLYGALIGGASAALLGNKDEPFWKRVGKGAAMGAVGSAATAIGGAAIGGAMSGFSAAPGAAAGAAAGAAPGAVAGAAPGAVAGAAPGAVAGAAPGGISGALSGAGQNVGSLFATDAAGQAVGSAGAGWASHVPKALGGSAFQAAPSVVPSTTPAPLPATSTSRAHVPATSTTRAHVPATSTTRAPVSTPALTTEHTTWDLPVGAPEGWNPALERQYSEAIQFHPGTTRGGIMDAHEIATWNKMPWYEKAQSKPGRFAMEYGPAGLMMGGLGLGMMNRGGGGTSPWISGPVSRFSEDPSLPASWEVHDEFIEEEERDRVG